MTKMEKRCTKLMNNATYVKPMENLRKRVDVKTSKQRQKLFKMYIETELYAAKNI